MKEIKFRAWDKVDEVMISWKELILEKDKGDDFYLLGYEENQVVTRYDHEQILMQYTGLKDKNGKEIYEADISWDEWNECYGVVRFDEGKFVYEWENVCEDLIEVHDYLDVSGNIYENPELK